MSTTGLTPQEFFARRIEGALMVDAQRTTGIAYSTIHRIAQGEGAASVSLVALAQWSRTNPSAIAEGVHISLDALVPGTVAAQPSQTPAADTAPRGEPRATATALSDLISRTIGEYIADANSALGLSEDCEPTHIACGWSGYELAAPYEVLECPTHGRYELWAFDGRECTAACDPKTVGMVFVYFGAFKTLDEVIESARSQAATWRAKGDALIELARGER